MKEQVVVYVDVFFFINFMMDALVLKLTSLVMKNNASRRRIAAAAALGGLYSVIILKPLLNHSSTITFTSIAVAFLMVYAAFGCRTPVLYLKSVIFLALTSFMFGGVMNYLYYATRVGAIVNEIIHGNSNKGINARKFVVVTLLAYGMMVLAVKFVRNYKKEVKLLYDVKLSFKGRSVVTTALFDTGNSLTEPVSGKMVHIAEYRILRPMFKGDEELSDRISVIPFQSVGEKNGILYGIRMDEMVVLVEGKPEFLYSPVIGVYHGELSKTGKYSMILHKETMERIQNNP